MSTPPIQLDTRRDVSAATRLPSLSDAQRTFSQVLSRDAGSGTREDRAREGAEALVSVALVQPIFQQLRESTAAAPPFAPNAAERSFRAMLDATLAHRLVASSRWGLVDAAARRLLGETRA